MYLSLTVTESFFRKKHTLSDLCIEKQQSKYLPQAQDELK